MDWLQYEYSGIWDSLAFVWGGWEVRGLKSGTISDGVCDYVALRELKGWMGWRGGGGCRGNDFYGMWDYSAWTWGGVHDYKTFRRCLVSVNRGFVLDRLVYDFCWYVKLCGILYVGVGGGGRLGCLGFFFFQFFFFFLFSLCTHTKRSENITSTKLYVANTQVYNHILEIYVSTWKETEIHHFFTLLMY